MITDQLKVRGISNQEVLDAIEKVPREQFVRKAQKEIAYADSPLPIGFKQTISQPFIVAFMTEALLGQNRERVLEVGTGSGYQAAILSKLYKQVFSVEIIEPLAKRATQLLKSLNYTNIEVKVGDGYEGWSEKGPYDAIIVTAAAPDVPAPLLIQLKNEGKLLIPIGTEKQELIRITKTTEGLKRESILPVRFVPFTRKTPEK